MRNFSDIDQEVGVRVVTGLQDYSAIRFTPIDGPPKVQYTSCVSRRYSIEALVQYSPNSKQLGTLFSSVVVEPTGSLYNSIQFQCE